MNPVYILKIDIALKSTKIHCFNFFFNFWVRKVCIIMEVDVSSKKQNEVLNEQENKIDREHERILNEIETTDTAFIGASLR